MRTRAVSRQQEGELAGRASRVQNVKETLSLHGFVVSSESEMKDGYGVRLDVAGDGIVNVYDSGTKIVQGRASKKLRDLFLSGGNKSPDDANRLVTHVQPNRRVYVVYSDDPTASASLEATLVRMKLEPVVLDQLPSKEQTIVEKLQDTVEGPCSAIVLASPEYEGRLGRNQTETMLRASQRVVCELGMMLLKCGRGRVAILVRNMVGMERPSDIAGLRYIPYENDPSDAAIPLARAMVEAGIPIDLEGI